jgi:hypothetical protein
VEHSRKGVWVGLNNPSSDFALNDCFTLRHTSEKPLAGFSTEGISQR